MVLDRLSSTTLQVRVRVDSTLAMGSGTNSLYKRLRKLGYNSYQEYLNSQHWIDIKKRFYSSKLPTKLNGRFCCSACFRTDVELHVHHRTYKTFGRENLHHLCLLCRPCHNLTHEREKEQRALGQQNLWAATAKIRSRKRRAARKRFRMKGYYL